MESLEREFTIEKFAVLIVINYSKVSYESYLNSELESILSELKKHRIYKYFFTCIDQRLEKNYKAITDQISIKEFEDKLYVTSKRDYMNQLVARCLKLSEGEPEFFNFFLVCVFICKFSECVHKRYDCYKILKLTADCLETVYCMKYSNYFSQNNGLQGFFQFCQRLYLEPATRRLPGGDRVTCSPEDVRPKWQEKVKILGCLNVIDNAVYLSEIDQRMQENIPFFISFSPNALEIFLVRKSKRSGNSQDDDNWEIVPNQKETGAVCEHCLAKCSDYSVYLVDQLTARKQSN